MRDENGKAKVYMSINRDISAYKKALTEISDKENLMRSFFNNTSTFMGILELKGDDLYIATSNLTSANYLDKTIDEFKV